jgi:hypothetical protein
MPIDAARMKKSVLRKHDEPKIKELRTHELAIATTRAAQAASTYLRRLMDGRAALGTNRRTGISLCTSAVLMARPVTDHLRMPQDVPTILRWYLLRQHEVAKGTYTGRLRAKP